MKTAPLVDMKQQLGADRVLHPPGVLPQPAERLDASGPVRPYEFEVELERLCLDSTSFRNIRERSNADSARMADRILEIVAARGKMHNPETDSGGVALGTVSAVGERCGSPPAVGDRIVTLASLTLTPLRLNAITRLDPDSAQIEVDGHAYVCDRSAWGPVPDDLPLATTLELYDVYAAGSHTHAMAPRDGTVCVLGVGHAGKLAMAAARDAMDGGAIVALDVDHAELERVKALGLCDVAVPADLRDPLGTLEAARQAGAPPADFTVVVVNAAGCEPTAILLTADQGTVLFFSMATNFSTAALTADGMSSNVGMLVGSGYTPDTGGYAFDLLRRSPALREVMRVKA